MVQTATDRFFRFMAAREAIRLRREAGEPWPWTEDPILRDFKFTNVKREHDRTTRWMRANWTGPNSSALGGDIVFNCALFRYFGTVRVATIVGWQHEWNPQSVLRKLDQELSRGGHLFTGAYIIPTLGKRGPKHRIVVDHVLTPLWLAREELAKIALDTQSWRIVGERLMVQPGFGGTGFMAKETLQDVMQTWVLRNAVDRNTWCPIGPGAQRGLNRILGNRVSYRLNVAVAQEFLTSLYSVAIRHLPAWMPQLELHDIQFQLCEFDKYERTRLGEGVPKARYRRRV